MKISRYRELAGPQAATQPGSHGRVLLNRLGLTSKRPLDLAEAQALARAQETYYGRLTARTRFTVTLIRQMHQAWLGDIFEWAGEYRQVELEKNGFSWPPAERIADNMLNFEHGILRQRTPCRPAALDEVATSIAVVHAELLLIHPFRDGNGRLALVGGHHGSTGWLSNPCLWLLRAWQQKTPGRVSACRSTGLCRELLAVGAFFRGRHFAQARA